MSRRGADFGDHEYIREPRRVQVRDYDDVEGGGRPAWMENRRAEPGPLVLRAREVETMERPRHRSPSPELRMRQRVVHRARSTSPGPRRYEEDLRVRQVVRETSRPPAERIRFVDRSRSSSPSPVRERIRIVEREKERAPSPAPPPRPPTPKVIKGPTIEREVITHYRDIDHGMVQVRPPSPPPAVRRERRDTEIDIYSSRHQTEVDIQRRRSRVRDRSMSRERLARPIQSWDDEVLVQADNRRLHVDIERRRSVSRGRRAHSAAPPVIHHDDDDEAREITSRIDARGRMGEAWNGITKDWTIIDVPPGTERVRMDGAGGAGADVTWSKYSGVRRSRFVPDRDEKDSVVSSATSLSEVRGRARSRSRERRLSVQIVDKDRDADVERVTDRRIAIRTGTPNPPRRGDTWTEITRDLVCREAIEQCGYEYEEVGYVFYIIEYLSQDDILRLVHLSERIRSGRRERAREIAWEREWRDDWDHRDHHHHQKRRYAVEYDEDRLVEREIVYDTRHPGRGYRH